ncbi:MAG: hypothetical protein RJB62_1676 [Pseudomonadota bacterium]|jgi:O-antigen ligase
MIFSLRGVLFLLTIIAFAAPGVRYLNVIFNTDTRWAFLGLLGIALLVRGQHFRAFHIRFGLLLGVYFFWCFLTAIWSEVPQLSLLKSAAFAMTVIVLVGAGHYWATHWHPKAPLAYLQAVLLVALLAGLGGAGAGAEEAGPGIQLYQGLSGNPNYLGMLVAMAFPLALYHAYVCHRDRRSTFSRMASIGLILVLAALLWWSASRSALLCVLITAGVFLTAFATDKKVFLIIALGLVGTGTAIITPELQQGVYTRLVIKSTDGEDIFFSRRGPWTDSYNAAVEGGWFGLGYGVSAGDTDFAAGLTANQYGREKGNTQLAVWEETGLVGVLLYFALLATIIAELYRGFRFAVTKEQRVIQSLLFGLTVGMTAVSVFEAWWTAPGAPESAIFWATFGVGAGMTQRIMAERYGTKPVFAAMGGAPARIIPAAPRA